jgi:hypothetical protein
MWQECLQCKQGTRGLGCELPGAECDGAQKKCEQRECDENASGQGRRDRVGGREGGREGGSARCCCHRMQHSILLPAATHASDRQVPRLLLG